MSDIDALKSERADLGRKLAARRDTSGYKQNCIEIKARIAEIDAELAAPPPEEPAQP